MTGDLLIVFHANIRYNDVDQSIAIASALFCTHRARQHRQTLATLETPLTLQN